MTLLEPIISAVVCTYNRYGLLKGALQSLSEQTLDKGQYEVIVVDNNSTDHTWQVAQEFAANHDNIKVVKEQRQGKSYALNTGIAASRGEYIAFMDDDAKASPDWLKRILEAFETVKPEPTAVGGKIYPWYEQIPPEWFTDDMEIRTWGEGKGFLQPPRAQYGFSGSNMAIPIKILEDYGGFVEGLGPSGEKFDTGEEITLFDKIYRDNPRFWYDPDIYVNHFVPTRKMSIKYRIKRAYVAGASMVLIQKKKSTISLIKLCLSVIYRICILPFCVKWWHKDWQKSFLEHAQPVAGTLGTVKGLIFRGYGRGRIGFWV